MRAKVLAIFLVSLFQSQGDLIIAQQAPNSVTVQSQGATLLAQSAAAVGGAITLSDVTLTGMARRTAGSYDETGTFTYKALHAGGNRYDFSYPSGVRSEIRPPSSAGVAGVWSGPEGSSGPIANHNLIADPGVFPAFVVTSLNRSNSGQTFVVAFAGQETKNGSSVYHLSAYQQFPQMSAAAATFVQHLTQTEIFLDAATLLPVAIDFTTHPDADALVDISVEIVFSNYHSVGGVQAPFHIQKYLNGGLVLDLQIQSVVLDTGVSASTFQVQ